MLEDSTVVAGERALPRLRVGAIVALALAAAFVAWLVTRPGPDIKPVAQIAPVRGAPRLVSAARLRALAATLGHPLYWAGGRAGMRYELTEAGGSRTYIRYLPASVKAGDTRARFLAIGTYAEHDALTQTQAAGARPGAVRLELGGGGIAVYDPKRPTSVYFAYPASNVQVEVYDPSARIARLLILTRQVVPIG
ncbi:MAG: hypothetical protein M3R37_02945 [Actinomycetota bacterium]|nr:hypothetical protein [Actinomycetota bacterium]